MHIWLDLTEIYNPVKFQPNQSIFVEMEEKKGSAQKWAQYDNYFFNYEKNSKNQNLTN